jgi:microcystin-dependent protein
MSEPFIAEIRIFAGNFAPRGWAFCDGQLLPIASNTALFSLIGTTYGGDGRTTTALPNLQGRAPMHPGRGPGLTNRQLGQKGGTESVALNQNTTPAHTHPAQVSLAGGDDNDPQTDAVLGAGATTTTFVYAPSSTTLDGSMASQALPNRGGSQPHTNLQPYLTLNYIIALVGTYPSRS